jgi:hypothetical protein
MTSQVDDLYAQSSHEISMVLPTIHAWRQASGPLKGGVPLSIRCLLSEALAPRGGGCPL